MYKADHLYKLEEKYPLQYMALLTHKVPPISSSKTLAMILCILLFHIVAAITVTGNGTIPAVFAFGDSIMDTGNNNYIILTPGKSNYPPYGRDFIGGKPTGRASNGKILSDLIAEGFGVKKILPPYLDPNLKLEDLLTGVCFASAGSGYDDLTAKLQLVLPLSKQIALFKEYQKKITKAVGNERRTSLLLKSVYILQIGSNDLINYFVTPLRRFQMDIPTYTNFMLESALKFVEDVQSLEGRVIGVLSIPPIGCLPLGRTIGGGVKRVCNETQNQAVMLFNSKLSALLNSPRNKRSHFSKLIYVDIYNPLLSMIQDPAQYGFEVVDKGCCGTGTVEQGPLCNKATPSTCNDSSKYLFWDSVHPTEKAYRILTSAIVNQIKKESL